jgi:hypothetical protein
MTASTNFVSAIRTLVFPHTFNPYSDHCEVFDKAAASEKRRELLSRVVAAAAGQGVHSVWIGRDLGYRGGRRTGLALTDDVHIRIHAARWGVKSDRATKGDPVKERTAALAWRILLQIEAPVFLWNVFPLHPHEPGAPFTNRAHTTKERAVGEEILSELLRLLRPTLIVGLGGDAARAAARIAPELTVAVRHPSYGGQALFLRQMSELYNLNGYASRACDLFSGP